MINKTYIFLLYFRYYVSMLHYMCYEMYVFTVPNIWWRHNGQSLSAGAHFTHEIKWLHGRNTTLISRSMQILQVR